MPRSIFNGVASLNLSIAELKGMKICTTTTGLASRSFKKQLEPHTNRLERPEHRLLVFSSMVYPQLKLPSFYYK